MLVITIAAQVVLDNREYTGVIRISVSQAKTKSLEPIELPIKSLLPWSSNPIQRGVQSDHQAFHAFVDVLK